MSEGEEKEVVFHSAGTEMAHVRGPSKYVVNEEHTYGRAFIHAANRNDVGEMSFLKVKFAVNVNYQDYDGRCALHVCARDGNAEAVTFLLEQEEIDINLADRAGVTALDEAIEHGHDEVVSLLIERKAVSGNTNMQALKLINAASAGDLMSVQRLLASGINPAAGDYDNRTALHVAVADGHVDVARCLLQHPLERGATPLYDVEDRWSVTPLKEVYRHSRGRGAHPMVTLFQELELLGGNDEGHGSVTFTKFSITFLFLQLAVIVLYFFCVDYASEASADYAGSEQRINTLYGWFQDVHVMIFIGFGYLMTFLRKCGFSAVGFTFLIGVFCIQVHILIGSFFEQLFVNKFHTIELTLSNLLYGDFAAGAVLITYGVVLGKVSKMQMLCIALVEVCFFSLNEAIKIHMNITDMGGSMVVHMFGAFFGLALSMAITRKDRSYASSEMISVYHSDMFAMIGTIFLWMYWPSFNASPANLPAQRHRAVINTVISLCGSGLTGLLTSSIYRGGRFEMADVQNATLAGGVAMGTACDLLITPGGALLVGAAAGFLSVVGYARIQAYLEERFGLLDTCGVNNLHGMPSVLGAVVGVFVTLWTNKSDYGAEQLGAIYPDVQSGERTMTEQAQFQAAYMFITIVVSSLSGLITGSVISNDWFEPLEEGQMFLDDVSFHVPELEVPYFFDVRGEVDRDDQGAQAPPGDTKPLIKSINSQDIRLAAVEQKLRKFKGQISAPTPAYPGFYPPQQSPELVSTLNRLAELLDKQKTN